MKRFVYLPIVLLLAASQLAAQETASRTAPAPPTFSVSYDPAITQSFTGRVYVMLSTRTPEARNGPSWFGPEPFYAIDVKDWKPDSPLKFDDNALNFPTPLSQLTAGTYHIQAVMRLNQDSPKIGSAPGNAYSASIQQAINPQSGALELRIDRIVPAIEFAETDRIKLVELRSAALSDFHGRERITRAAIILPDGYDLPENKDRKYPALYWIGGFGSDHYSARFLHRGWSQLGHDDHIFRVVLDPLGYGGHHTFADSENNGPVGTALVQEFIPHLERTYRLVAAPYGRFLSGHSSGGWTSLWLQVAYPDTFGGAWAIAPDPVDFRDFQRIDLYKPGVNMYVDESGANRPIARSGENPFLWYKDFAQMEHVQGEGGQLRSFEWVFSRRGDDGKPMMLFDRATGAVDSKVAQSWKRYDIRLLLEAQWPLIGPKLDNGAKLNVFMGELDTFYLDGATRLLQQSQKGLGSKAVIEIEPYKDHMTIASGPLRQRIDNEVVAVFTRHHPEFAPEKYPKPKKTDQ